MRYPHSGSFKIFAGQPLSAYLSILEETMRSRIQQEGEDYILNVSETEYINFRTSKLTVETPVIDFDGVSVTSYEGEIPADQLPMEFRFGRELSRRTYPKQVVVYHLPLTGDEELLHYSPSGFPTWTYDMYVRDGELCFEVVNYYDRADDVKRDAKSILDALRPNSEQMGRIVDQFNSGLRGKVESAFRARKDTLLKRRNTLAQLGVPLKRRENLPQTYAIPTPQMRRSVSVKPVVTASGFKPEPTLSQPDYESILQTIHDLGKEMERLPSLYEGKGEEALRDLILLYLEPRYEGSTTGETFNATGKTDILMRYEQSNVFIAECKFWSGEKKYLETITQLLGYLTWRDSKAAVVVFVRNKEISPVVKAVTETTPKHDNYLGFVGKIDESWLNYRFHINGDENREVKLAVLLFHLPRE